MFHRPSTFKSSIFDIFSPYYVISVRRMHIGTVTLIYIHLKLVFTINVNFSVIIVAKKDKKKVLLITLFYRKSLFGKQYVSVTTLRYLDTLSVFFQLGTWDCSKFQTSVPSSEFGTWAKFRFPNLGQSQVRPDFRFSNLGRS